jgi:hypothetical protein
MSKVFKKCNECGKMSDLTTTCSFPSGDNDIELCPTCLKEDGNFCLSCGAFCSGLQSFDFIHPGYCDTCWDEIESDYNDDEEEEGNDPNWYADPKGSDDF